MERYSPVSSTAVSFPAFLASLLAFSAWLASCAGGARVGEERAFFERHAAPGKPGLLRCYFVDTDTGDAALLVSPSGRSVLIDAGTAGGGAVVTQHLVALGIDKLDVVVLSHPDYDHYGGLRRVVRRFPPLEFYHSGLTSWTPAYRAFRRTIARAGCSARAVRKGDAIPLGGDLACSVLWPPPDIEPDSTSLHFANTNSLVLKIRFREFSLLFCGDIKEDTEDVLARNDGDSLRAGVLKVAHHGSASSSSRAFLKAVRPQVAVIAGERGNLERGAFGRAAPDVIARLEDVGSTVVRLRHAGSLLVETDGHTITRLETARRQVAGIEAEDQRRSCR